MIFESAAVGTDIVRGEWVVDVVEGMMRMYCVFVVASKRSTMTLDLIQRQVAGLIFSAPKKVLHEYGHCWY